MAGSKMLTVGGFTPPNNEFTTLYRIINGGRSVPRHGDLPWCRRETGMLRQLERPRMITADGMDNPK